MKALIVVLWVYAAFLAAVLIAVVATDAATFVRRIHKKERK